MQDDLMMQELTDEQLEMVAGGGKKKSEPKPAQPTTSVSVSNTYLLVDSHGNQIISATAILSPTVTTLLSLPIK